MKLCDELGAATPAADKYAAQKTRAEQAFWAFQAQRAPKWDGVALNPGFCLGPPTLYGGGLDGSSLCEWFGRVGQPLHRCADATPHPDVLKPFLRTSTPAELDEAIGNFVDVRDGALWLQD